MVQRIKFNSDTKSFSYKFDEETEGVLNVMPKIFRKLYILGEEFEQFVKNKRYTIRTGDPTLYCFLSVWWNAKIVYESMTEFNWDHYAKNQCGILKGTRVEVISCNSGTNDFEIWYDFKTNTSYVNESGRFSRVNDIKKSILDYYTEVYSTYKLKGISPSNEYIFDCLKWLVDKIKII